jgi:flagellar hook-associated protein 1 FlgK
VTSSVFQIGYSGLAAAQAGLSTTGHNISNVNTPGFTRQRIVQSANPAQPTEVGYIGKGASVTTTERIYDQFLTTQVREVDSQLSGANTLSQQLATLTSVLGDESTGLSSSIDEFFGAFDAVAANPSDLGARATLISGANALVQRMRDTDNALNAQRTNTNQAIQSTAGQVNQFAVRIADLNRQIREGLAHGHAPNDLLDERDNVARELSKLVKVNVVNQTDGTANVFIGTGQTLVIGSTTYDMSTQPDPKSPADVQLIIRSAQGGSVAIDPKTLGGGSIASYFDFRDRLVGGAQNAIGRIATVLTNEVNSQHALGVDRTGTQGGAFFGALPAPSTIRNTMNTGPGTINGTITNMANLVPTDYRVTYDGSSFAVTRTSDGTVTNFASLPATLDGAVQLAVSGTINPGDSFIVQPVRNAVAGLTVSMTDPSRIAAASPVASAASAANVGNATISTATVNSAAAFSGTTFAIRFAGSGAGTTYDIVDTSTNTTVSAANAYTSGGTITHSGWSVSVSGTPRAGDVFTVAPNTTGMGDNRNAKALAALNSKSVIGGGTLVEAYGQLIGQVGLAGQDAQLRVKSQTVALKSAEDAQSSVSGVNLDEEAANLIRYQQAYQASAKFIQIASQLFDELMNTAGR